MDAKTQIFPFLCSAGRSWWSQSGWRITSEHNDVQRERRDALSLYESFLELRDSPGIPWGSPLLNLIGQMDITYLCPDQSLAGMWTNREACP